MKEVRMVLKRMKNGKADGSIPVEVWKCSGEMTMVSDWVV